VVLHFPVLLTRPRRLAAGELHLIVTGRTLITVHDGDLRPLVRLFETLRDDAGRRATEMASPGRLAYAVLMALVEASAPLIERLSGQLETLQDEIFGRTPRDPVRQIAAVRRELIRLRRMLHPAPGIVATLADAPRAADGGLASYWSDLQDHLRRLVDYLDDVRETLEALSHSYDQLTAHRMNSLIRVLTVISTVLLPLAVISGVYGMYFRGLPWAESDWAFEIAVAVMLAVVIGMLGLFRRRGWI
jgi:magnesium transporter